MLEEVTLGQGVTSVTLTAKNRVTEQPRPISPQPRPGSKMLQKKRFCSLCHDVKRLGMAWWCWMAVIILARIEYMKPWCSDDDSLSMDINGRTMALWNGMKQDDTDPIPPGPQSQTPLNGPKMSQTCVNPRLPTASAACKKYWGLIRGKEWQVVIPWYSYHISANSCQPIHCTLLLQGRVPSGKSPPSCEWLEIRLPSFNGKIINRIQ